VDEQRRPPEVTVRDPAAPAPAPDLLSSGDEPARPRRRRWLALPAAVAVVAAGLAVTDARDDARSQRRQAAAVDLALVAFASERRRYDADTGAFELQLLLQLRNDGPRPVTVLRGGVGGYALERDVALQPGELSPLPLTRSVRCGSAAADAARGSDDLELTVGTDAGPRDVRLSVPFEVPDDAAARACGFLPLDEAVTAQVVGVETRRGSLRLALDVRSVANRPVEVVAATAVDPGVQARLEEAADAPVALPIPGPGGTGTTRLHVVLTIADCASAAGLPGAPSSRAVRLAVQEPGGATAQPRVGYDPALLAALIGQAC
jgi:hypothetical protein